MTHVYIVNHLNVFHSLILQNLTTMEYTSTTTNVYIVSHLNVFHSLILQKLTTCGAHK